MIRFAKIKGHIYVIIACLAAIYILISVSGQWLSATSSWSNEKFDQTLSVPKNNSGEEEEDFMRTFWENMRMRKLRLETACRRFVSGDYLDGVLLKPDYYQYHGNSDLWLFPDSKLVWCDVPKSGSSTIRTLAVEGILGTRHRIERCESLQYKDSMMIYRHPIERLYSGYMNKIVTSEVEHVPGMTVEEGSKLSFPQFLDVVTNNPNSYTNWLFQPTARLCNPCFYNYTYLLDVDNLSTEAAAFVFQITGKRVGVGHANKHEGDKPKTVEDILDGVSAETVQKLVNQFYLDFLLFGYSLDETMDIIKRKQIQEAAAAEKIPEAEAQDTNA